MNASIPQISTTSSPFDSIRQTEQDREFWSARDLQSLLGYTEWRKFEDAIERAMLSCKNSGQEEQNHFVGGDKMVTVGSGAERKIQDYHLTRYACYLVAMNSDPRKEEVSAAQSYFAIKTREAEVALSPELFQELTAHFKEKVDSLKGIDYLTIDLLEVTVHRIREYSYDHKPLIENLRKKKQITEKDKEQYLKTLKNLDADLQIATNVLKEALELENKLIDTMQEHSELTDRILNPLPEQKQLI